MMSNLPPNVTKFAFLKPLGDDHSVRDNACKLVSEVSEPVQLIICPALNAEICCHMPKDSPGSSKNMWAKLKHISEDNVSLWSKGNKHTNMRSVFLNHLDCYLVPMKDVFYTHDERDGRNYELYVKHNDEFYHVTLDPYRMVTCLDTSSMVLRNLVDNHVYQAPLNTTYGEWADGGWAMADWPKDHYSDPTNAWSTHIPPTHEWSEPMTPEQMTPEPTTPEFDNEASVMTNIIDMLNDSASDESDESSDIELTSGSEEEYAGEEVNDDESNDDSEYEPESDEEEEYDDFHDDDFHDDDADEYDEYEMYEEWRQDLNGEWYTRREFYDWYGSDEAWDNLDPETFHSHRFNEMLDIWMTKEEFYQYYGSDRIWKRMHPHRIMKREAVGRVYWWASYLPERIQDHYIRDMMSTYE